MKKRRKTEKRRGTAPQTVRHEGKTYRRDVRGNYRDDGGDILPSVILASILGSSSTDDSPADDAEASSETSDFGDGGSDGGGGGGGD